ncbi:5'-nucleotidase [Alcanivorax sp. VBW004]|nr:5'-nucleotidase [Alcanivorax sp. VBW004]EDX89113.1 5'-nucleotidase superfamily [Alcanivorax sp. DG881]MTT53405.1 5'-nucleotidase [Alcanivorax sp. VBW004]
MPVTFDGKLVIAISSRALFNLSDSHRVYLEEGLEAFQDYQVQHEDDLLEPGDAFPLVQKLLAINDLEKGKGRVEVILLSRNSSDTGLRVFNSIAHYGLPITRAAFASGESPHRYVSAFGAHLFLSTDPGDVQQVLEAGYAAATILSGGQCQRPDGILRIAFDGDAVLFSDESEQIFQNAGLEAFTENERQSARKPMDGGPFKPFLAALHQLQNSFPVEECPIRTALVTARGAPAHERVVRTLRDWDIRLDESLFLGGLSKGEFLRAFGADVFFDDQQGHCESAAEHVAAGHVPHGISNKKKDAPPV